MKSKSKPKTSIKKLPIRLATDVLSGLNKEIARIKSRNSGLRPTRSSIADGMIRSGLLRTATEKEERIESYKKILIEADHMKNRARHLREEGKISESNRCYLMAAAIEMEALAVFGFDDERVIKSTIIETLFILKMATGYKYLPEVPSKLDISSSART